MVSIETELRDELHRADDVVQMPPGTIDRALFTAGRYRRRRRVGAAIGAVACAAAVTVPVVTLRNSGPSGATAAAHGRLVVGEYEAFSGHRSSTNRVLDPTTGKYVVEPQINGKRALDVSFAPNGRNVIFRSNDYDSHFYLASTADFAAGRMSKAVSITPVVGADTMAGSAHWSPDGKSILLPYYKYKGKKQSGFQLYDVASRTTGPRVTLPSVDIDVSWGRSPTEIVGTFAAVGKEPAGSVRFYSLDGKLRSQVTITAGKDPASDVAKLGPFSPTGRYITLASSRIYDMRTHRLMPEPTLPSCADKSAPVPDGWYSSDSYLLLCSTSPAINVVNVNGQVERTIKLPFGSAQMPSTSGGKVGKLNAVTFAGTAGFPGSGGVRF